MASIFNLAGPDLIIILVILLMLGGPFLLIHLLGGSGRGSSAPPPVRPPPIPSTKDRLEQLELLRLQGHISEVEYAEQRYRILSSI